MTDDAIILGLELQHLEPFSIILEQITIDSFKGDGTTTEFTLTNLNTTTDTITVFVDIKQMQLIQMELLFTLSVQLLHLILKQTEQDKT